jgi:UDP-N-acetylmuramoylalanine--D-glutamate ligase
MSELSGKSVVVVGLGASGVSAARLCLRRGARVLGTDAKPRAALGASALALEAEGAKLSVGANDEAAILSADLVVVSPGVPSFPALDAAEKKGIPVLGEVELACRELAHPAPIVAVGGTNGKSTTTTLVGELLAASGKKVFVGGNLGEPLAEHVDERFDVVVLEVSSFQMERVDRFHPHVALLLNVTADHLDRYPSMDAYAAAKGNAFLRQEESDVAVVPYGDAVCLREARRGKGQVRTFGGPGSDVEVTEDAILDHEASVSYARSLLRISGGHNALNAAAAIAAVTPFGVSPETVREVLARFEGLAHRMVLVGESRGVRFYDDSKGTNVGATVAALANVVEPKAVLVAGGRDKGGSYAPLVAALADKGRAVVVLGEAKEAIAKAVGSTLPVFVANDMEDAVRLAAAAAQPGDAVLLSPACSSFDMFKDYKERGDVFAAAVRKLAAERGEGSS